MREFHRSSQGNRPASFSNFSLALGNSMSLGQDGQPLRLLLSEVNEEMKRKGYGQDDNCREAGRQPICVQYRRASPDSVARAWERQSRMIEYKDSCSVEIMLL